MAESVLNKSFLYLFPIMYRDIINQTKIDYSLFYDKSMFNVVNNTYSYVMDNEQFAISFLDSDINEYIEGVFKLYKETITIDKSIDKITIILSIPESAKDCYNKFINGKYSKIDDIDKKEIIKFVKTFLNSHGKDSEKLIDSIVQVLYKDKRRADFLKLRMGLRDDEWNDEWEVSSIIEKDTENYILSK